MQSFNGAFGGCLYCLNIFCLTPYSEYWRLNEGFGSFNFLYNQHPFCNFLHLNVKSEKCIKTYKQGEHVSALRCRVHFTQVVIQRLFVHNN